MRQQFVAWLAAMLAVLAVAEGRQWSEEQAPDWAPDRRTVTFTVDVDQSLRGRKRSARFQRVNGELVTRNFPVADLISGPPAGGPAFGDASELMRVLRKTTGQRHWRGDGEMVWLERRQLLHVKNRAPVVEDVERLIGTLRNTRHSHVEVTVRLLVVPPESDAGPRSGSARVISAARSNRLWKRWKSYDTSDRNHEAHYRLADRDIVYVWTSRDESRESTMRGLNVVVQPSDDGRGALLTPYPFIGDEEKVDWTDLVVGIEQCVVFDLPMASAAPDDVDRILAIVSVDSVSPSANSGDD